MHPRRASLVAGAAAIAVACSACGGTEAATPTPASAPQTLEHPTAGVSISYPSGWDATTRPLTEVVWPPERLAAATYPLDDIEPGRDCNPGPALAALPRDGALLHLFEYTKRASGDGDGDARDFPDRPPRFSLEPESLLNYECAGLSYAIVFTDGGRRFQVHVWFGEQAADATRGEALAILDSLRVNPAG